MGGIFGIGNSSAKTDRGRQLGGWNAMWDSWSRAVGAQPNLESTGTAATQEGLGNLSQSSDFWKSIISGNKGTSAAATAPITNAAQSRADQQRTEQAQMGTARGGGTAGYNVGAQEGVNATAANAAFGMLPTAATQLAQTGEATAGVGNRELALALQSLGISADVAESIVKTSTTSRDQSFEQSPARIGEAGILHGLVKALPFL